MATIQEQATTAGQPPDFIEAGGGDRYDDDEFMPQEWDGRSSASASLASSVQRHAYANGRRYHSYRDGRYPIPNDETEQNREHMKHAMVLELSDGKLFHAPIGRNPQKIIDLGTGTGIWALEVGEEYPGAKVTGADLSPIQPGWVPPNVHFIVDDVEDDWLFDNDFDFIHMRNLATWVHDLPKLLQRCFNNLKPGAWVETQDFNSNVACDDSTMPADWPLLQFWAQLHEAMMLLNVDIRIAPRIGELMADAGFVNVTKTAYKVPVGAWPRNCTLNLVGDYMRTITEGLLGAAASKPLLKLGLTTTEIEVFLMCVRSALKDRSVHAYGTYYSWAGQKPYNDDKSV